MNSLNLLGNWLTSHSKTAISNMIREGALVSLNLSYNKLGESGVCEISKALQASLTLQDLCLSNNAIGPSGIQSIAVVLCHNRALVSLNLAENNLDDGGAYEISKALQVNSTLKKLLLSRNAIAVNGAISLANALCQNHTLEDLCLENNKVLDEGAIAICECVKLNNTLKSIDLTGNDITQTGAKSLSKFFDHSLVFSTLTIEVNCAKVIYENCKQTLSVQTMHSYRHSGKKGYKICHYPAALSRSMWSSSENCSQTFTVKLKIM